MDACPQDDFVVFVVHRFSKGRRVELIGMQKQIELNGQRGFVSTDTKQGRIAVMMDKDGSLVQIHPPSGCACK